MPLVSYLSKTTKEEVNINISTYKEVKKNLKTYLKDCMTVFPIVYVYRTRRGEWGEWYEHWTLDGDKLKIIAKGWM